MKGKSNYEILKLLFPSTPFISFHSEIKRVEGNSNFKITISFHSSIFGMEGQKMEWKEIATPLIGIKSST